MRIETQTFTITLQSYLLRSVEDTPEILLSVCKWIKNWLTLRKKEAGPFPFNLEGLREFVLEISTGTHLGEFEVLLNNLLNTIPFVAKRQLEEMIDPYWTVIR